MTDSGQSSSKPKKQDEEQKPLPVETGGGKQTFFHLGLAPAMLTALEKFKFITPTPIQHKAIPVALEGQDIVGIAQTGTGKTLAFGIPAIQTLIAEGGRAMVVVPTRELALQVDDALRPLLKEFGKSSTVLIGGLPIKQQIAALNSNPEVLIGTPGRLIDHIYQGTMDLGDIKVLILDEADRMLDMGFAPQVDRIISCLPRKRQTMLFSATMPAEIAQMAAQHMRLPVNIEIAPSGTTIEDITQELFIVRENVKKRLLGILLKKYRGAVLIFTRTKIKAARITQMVRETGAKVAEIHSDRNMSQRIGAIDGFKLGRFRVLVATDIAARGIDVSNIELVINYDLPEDIDNYVHRIGRTGRAGRSGHAITMATPSQTVEIAQIEKFIRKRLPRSEMEGVEHIPESEYKDGARKRPRRRRSERARKDSSSS